MLNKIRDFICRYRFWVYLGGFILLIIGASLAGWVSSYFLIVVVVGLIAIAGSILVKNKEEKDRPKGNVIEGAKTSESHLENTNQGIYTLKNDTQYNPDQAALPISNTSTTPTWENNKELEAYKKEARKKITQKYVQRLLTSVENKEKINESKDMCSNLFKENGTGVRGDTDAFNIIKMHFDQIKIEDISENPEIIMRGDIEVLFEILTGVEWSKAEYMSGTFYGLAKELNFAAQGQGHHNFSKCFFEHTILCALAIYKNRDLLELYTNENLTNEDAEKQRPLMQFYDWDENHKHGSVLKKPNAQSIPVQDLLK